MDNRNNMAQLRYLEEAAVRLTRENFDTGQIEDHHLPVSWNGSYLCRISGTGQRSVSPTECREQWRTGRTSNCCQHRKTDF